MQQYNVVPAMPRRIVEMMLARPAGPPLVAVPEVAEIGSQVVLVIEGDQGTLEATAETPKLQEPAHGTIVE